MSRLLAYYSVFSIVLPHTPKINTKCGEEEDGPVKPQTLGKGGLGGGHVRSYEISLSHHHTVVSGRPGPCLKKFPLKGKEAAAKNISCQLL